MRPAVMRLTLEHSAGMQVRGTEEPRPASHTESLTRRPREEMGGGELAAPALASGIGKAVWVNELVLPIDHEELPPMSPMSPAAW